MTGNLTEATLHALAGSTHTPVAQGWRALGGLVALPALPAPLPAGWGVGARVPAGPAHRRGEQVVHRLHRAQQLLEDAADDVSSCGAEPTAYS
jgi:hypothetical protein